MPQHVFIQTDIPAAPGLARKTATANDKAQYDGFAAQLNKYTEPQQKAANKAAETADTQYAEQGAEAATAVESEKNTVDDGNKLPPEQSASNTKNRETPAADDNVSEQPGEQGTVIIEEARTGDVVSASVKNSNTVQAPQSEAAAAHGVSLDRPIRAQVEVSQNAIANAKAAPVEMTAKSEPVQKNSEAQATVQKSVLKLAEQTRVSDKTVALDTKQTNATSTQQKSVAVLPVNVEKLLAEEKATVNKGQPNLAAILEAKEKTDSKTINIRADILDALQRKNGDKDVSINLRNMIAAQMQEQSEKSDITKALLTAERGVHEAKNAAPGAGFSSLTATSATIATTTSTQTLSLPVQPNMQNPAWSQVMSSRVVWMAKEGVQQAQLKMTPANLGPVEVRLQLHKDQASVTFLAQHSATRDALEQAIPRLRESFAEAGIELGHTEVSEQQHQQEGETEYADDSHIFAQASSTSDDIENEQEVEQPLGETTAGLSIYA